MGSEQLISIFSSSVDLKKGLLNHWASLPEYQRSQVLPSLQQLLNAPDAPQQKQSSANSASDQQSKEKPTRKRSLAAAENDSEISEVRPQGSDVKGNSQVVDLEAEESDNTSSKKRKQSTGDEQSTTLPEYFAQLMESVCVEIIDEIADQVCSEMCEQVSDETVDETPAEIFIYNDLVDVFMADEAFSVALESKTELELFG